MCNWKITGDCHGDMSRFSRYADSAEMVNIICLGDFGVNYYLNKRDYKLKQQLKDTLPNVTFYLVRGNHEARPESLITMKNVYDKQVEGNVWQEDEFPNIKYLQDGEVYTFNGKRALVIGGAYSVDKEYRLVNGWQWFPTEQLNAAERENITQKYAGQHFDFVFSHTCPYPWMPFDKFLPTIDQTKVDNSMEYWMEDLSHKISYTVWCFGHYHTDRQINYFSAILSESIIDMDKMFKNYKRLQRKISK